MTRRFVLALATAVLLALAYTPLSADTHSPQTQTLQMDCGGQILTFVSPNFHAKSGQALDDSQVGVAFLITAGDEVLYESPAFEHIPPGLFTVCDAGGLTFYMLLV